MIFYSSELPEITLLATRCLVLYAGQVQAELSGNDVEERKLVAAMTGHDGKSDQSAAARASPQKALHQHGQRRASAMLTNGTVLVAILYVLLFVANVAMQSEHSIFPA